MADNTQSEVYNLFKVYEPSSTPKERSKTEGSVSSLPTLNSTNKKISGTSKNPKKIIRPVGGAASEGNLPPLAPPLAQPAAQAAEPEPPPIPEQSAVVGKLSPVERRIKKELDKITKTFNDHAEAIRRHMPEHVDQKYLDREYAIVLNTESKLEEARIIRNLFDENGILLLTWLEVLDFDSDHYKDVNITIGERKLSLTYIKNIYKTIVQYKKLISVDKGVVTYEKNKFNDDVDLIYDNFTYIYDYVEQVFILHQKKRDIIQAIDFARIRYPKLELNLDELWGANTDEDIKKFSDKFNAKLDELDRHEIEELQKRIKDMESIDKRNITPARLKSIVSEIEDKYKESLKSLETQLELDMQKNNEEYERRIKELREEKQEHNITAINILQEKADQCKKLSEERQKTIETLKKQIKDHEIFRRSIQDEREQLERDWKQATSEYRIKLDELETKLKTQDIEIAKLKQTNEELEDKAHQIEAKLREAEAAINKKTEENVELRAMNEELNKMGEIQAVVVKNGKFVPNARINELTEIIRNKEVEMAGLKAENIIDSNKLQNEIRRLRKELEELIRKSTHELETAEKKIQEMNQEIISLRENGANESKKRITELEEQILTLQKTTTAESDEKLAHQADTFNIQYRDLLSQLKLKEVELEKIKSARNDSESKNKELDGKNQEHINRLNQEIERLKAEIKKKMDDHKDEIDRLQQQFNTNLATQKTASDLDFDALKNQNADLQARIAQLTNSLSLIQAELLSEKELKKQLQYAIDAKEIQINSLNEQIQQYTSSIETIKKNLADEHSRDVNLLKQKSLDILNLTAYITHMSAELTKVTAQRDNLLSTKSTIEGQKRKDNENTSKLRSQLQSAEEAHQNEIVISAAAAAAAATEKGILETQIRKISDEKLELEAQIRTLTDQNIRQSTELQSKEAELVAAKQSSDTELEGKIDELTEDKRLLTEEMQKDKNAVNIRGDIIESMNEELTAKNNEIQILTTQLISAEKGDVEIKNNLTARLRDAKKEIEQLQDELAKKNKESMSLRDELGQLTTKNTGLEEENSKIKSNIDQLIQNALETTRLNSELINVRRANVKLEEQLRESLSEVKRLKYEITELKNNNSGKPDADKILLERIMQDRINRLIAINEQNIKQYEDHVTQLETELAEIREELEKSKKENLMLRAGSKFYIGFMRGKILKKEQEVADAKEEASTSKAKADENEQKAAEAIAEKMEAERKAAEEKEKAEKSKEKAKTAKAAKMEAEKMEKVAKERAEKEEALRIEKERELSATTQKFNEIKSGYALPDGKWYIDKGISIERAYATMEEAAAEVKSRLFPHTFFLINNIWLVLVIWIFLVIGLMVLIFALKVSQGLWIPVASVLFVLFLVWLYYAVNHTDKIINLTRIIY